MAHLIFDDVQELLNDVDFPASKQDLVAHAESRGGAHDSPAVKALRAMPLGTYDNMSQVRSSVALPPSETPD